MRISLDLLAMNIFPENYCRICSEFFCCKICRLDHEQSCHGIHPECNICIYGRAFLKDPSESLLQHFRAVHWPLHCTFCKKLFLSIEELTVHAKCVIPQKISQQENSVIPTSILPPSSIEQSYDSPPIMATMHKSILTSSNKHFNSHNDTVSLTTSTPMQKSNERELLQHIPDVITPVDYSEKTDTSAKLKSISATESGVTSTASEQSKNAEPHLKRRVTFSEIEIINIETPFHGRKTKYVPSYEMNSKTKEEQIVCTPECGSTNRNVVTGNRNENPERNIYGGTSESDMYTTACNEDLADTPKISAKVEYTTAYDFTDLAKSYETTNDDTAWESALMDPNATPEVPSSAVNENLTESVNSTKSEILSPILDQKLTRSNILSSTTNSSLPKSEILSPASNQDLVEAASQPAVKSPSVTKSEILSPLVHHSLKELEDTQSHIIIMEENSIKSEILSLVIHENLKESNISTSVMNTNLKISKTLSVAKDKNLIKSEFSSAMHSNLAKVEADQNPSELEISSPITNENLTSKILSLEMNPRVDCDTSNKDINYDALELSTTSEQADMNITSQKLGIWSSMANIFKTMVQGLSRSTEGNDATNISLTSLDHSCSQTLNDCIAKHTHTQRGSHKRAKPEADASVSESPTRKRIKLTHIKCRRTIRNVKPSFELKHGKKKVSTIDRSTQTD